MAARPRVLLKQFVKPTPPVDIEARKKSMTQWLHEESKKNPIVLKDAFDRNIIFVGPTRAGKSTVFEVLKDPFFFTQMGSIFSDTRDAKINHFTVEVPTEAGVANYNIAIIDTPGLFEVHAVGSGKETRPDEVLEDVILKCLNVEITKIHSIFFVFAYTGALNPNDIKALEKFIELFSGAGQFIHMLITHAEALTDQRKEEIKAELMKVQSLAALIDNTTARFHFSGAVDETYQKQGMLDVVQDRMTNVLNMRNELFEEIFAADQFFELNSIDKSGTLRDKAIVLMKKLQKELSSLPLENPATFERQCRDLSSKKAVLLAAQRTECEEFLKKASDHLEYLQACRFLEQLPKDWQNQLQKSPLKFKYECKEFFRLAPLHLSGDQLAQASDFFTTIQEHWTPEP